MQVDRYRGIKPTGGGGGGDLADILERVLDKGVVVAGDIVINLLDIELLTIKLRLLIASADTAREMGIDWWENDPFLSSRARRRQQEEDRRGGEVGVGAAAEVRAGSGRDDIDERLGRIEASLAALARRGTPGGRGPEDADDPSRIPGGSGGPTSGRAAGGGRPAGAGEWSGEGTA